MVKLLLRAKLDLDVLVVIVQEKHLSHCQKTSVNSLIIRLVKCNTFIVPQSIKSLSRRTWRSRIVIKSAVDDYFKRFVVMTI